MDGIEARIGEIDKLIALYGESLHEQHMKFIRLVKVWQKAKMELKKKLAKGSEKS